MKKNKFSKALKHIKKDLNEVAPTNSMSGVYSLNDPGYSLRHPSGPKLFRTDKDGNFPSGIPGTPGTPYTRPGGIWTGEQDWDEIVPASFSHDLQGADGNGTDGLIGENGVVYADLPPNSRSYILGPLVDGFVVNHVYDAYTRIGYIQKDTRQFVLLAKIFGTWKTGFPALTGAYKYESNYTYPVWDGTTVHSTSGFHTYGSFTLADAQWMRAQILEGKYVKNVAYRNSGGIQQTWMQYYGALTGLGIFYNGVGVGAGSGDAVDGDGGGGGYGQGGDPTIGTQQTDPPKKGDAEDAGFPWFPFGNLGKKAKELWDKITDAVGDIKDNLEEFFDDAFDDAVEGATDFKDSLQDVLDDWSGQPKDNTTVNTGGGQTGGGQTGGGQTGQDTGGNVETHGTYKDEPKDDKPKDDKPKDDGDLSDILTPGGGSLSKDDIKKAKDQVGNWFNNLKDWAQGVGDLAKLVPSGIEAVPTSANALQQYLNNNDPKHPDYRKNDPRSDNYEGPYEPPTDSKWKNEVGKQIKNSIPGWSDMEERAKNSPDGKTQLTNHEITAISNSMKPPYGEGDMRFHTLLNSLPVTGNEYSDDIPGDDAVTTFTLDKDGNIDIVTNYRFSDRDDVSSGGPLMKMYVQSYMDKDKGDGEGVFPFYDKDGQYDNRTQVGTTHDINMRLRLNINGGNSSTWGAQAKDVKNFKNSMSNFSLGSMMNSYYPQGKLISESRSLRKVKFVMEDVAAAPAPTTPTNQTTTQQPTTEKTDSKETADALAKEYIEKNGPEKTKELIDKTDEYLAAHGAGAEPLPHAQSDVDRENIDQEVESDINANDELDQDQKETHKKNWGIVAATNRKIDADSGKDKNIYNSKVDNNFKIAHSILQNRVVNHTYPPNLINDYFKSYVTLGRFLGYPDLAAQQQGASYYMIPIVSKEMGYADDNIWVDEQGGINNNTSDTQQMVNRAALAYDNGFKEIGQGMSQLVIPSDGGVPYVIFKDYNYHNLRSNDPGEVPNIILDGLSGIIHGKSWIKDVLSGSISKSLGSGWPEGIHGAAYTTFRRNLDQLNPAIQTMIKSHPLYWTDLRYEKLFADEEAFDKEYSRIKEKLGWRSNEVKQIDDKWFKTTGEGKEARNVGLDPAFNDIMNQGRANWYKYEELKDANDDEYWRGGPNKRGIHGDLAQEWLDWIDPDLITDQPQWEDSIHAKEYAPIEDEFMKFHKSLGGTKDEDGTYRVRGTKEEMAEWQRRFDEFNKAGTKLYDKFMDDYHIWSDKRSVKKKEIERRRDEARAAYDERKAKIKSDYEVVRDALTDQFMPLWEAVQREQIKLYHSTHFDKVYVANGMGRESFVPSGPTPINYKQYDYKDAFSIGAGTPGGIGGTGDAATAADLAGERKKKKKKLEVSSYKPKGRRLQESDLNLSRRKVRMLKEIKKPVSPFELSPQKLSKYKPNFKGKYSPQNTPDKTASKESDALVMSGNQKGQAWRTQDKYWSGYETQERMNIIQDRLGHGDLAWQMIVDEAREKNGWKNREVQEHLNIIAAEKGMREQVPDYESPFGYVIHEQGASTEEELDTVMKDPLVKKVAKRLRTQIDYKDKPSRKGFPDEPPAKQQDGWHPEYGKKYKYDKLDPQSAEAMPPTGNPEIDANVEKAKPKKPRWKHINTESKVDPKVKWQESVDWRQELKEVTKDT